jgi:hypothetical protein
VIRNDALRRDLVDDYERIQDILRPTDFNLDRAGYRQAIRSVLPLDVQIAIRTCSRNQPPDSGRDAFQGLALQHAVEAVFAREEPVSEFVLYAVGWTLRWLSGWRCSKIARRWKATSDGEAG